MGSSVELERHDATMVITLNRPAVLNAIDVELRETLITLLTELNKDDGVRAVVLTGAGNRAFCSGRIACLPAFFERAAAFDDREESRNGMNVLRGSS